MPKGTRNFIEGNKRKKREGGSAGKINSTLYSSPFTKQSETNTTPKTLNTPKNNLGNENRLEP